MSEHTPGPWFIWKERAMQEEGLEAGEINEELLEFEYFEVMAGTPVGEVSRGRIRGCKQVVELDAEDFGDEPEDGRRIALANARLIAAAPDLLAALKLALPFLEQEAVISGYGYYRPANPHDFHPDHECCTAEEIENHKAACEAYDAGNYRDDYGDGWIAPNVHVTKAPWGIGSYTDDIPELKAQAEFCRAAIAKAEAGRGEG